MSIQLWTLHIIDLRNHNNWSIVFLHNKVFKLSFKANRNAFWLFLLDITNNKEPLIRNFLWIQYDSNVLSLFRVSINLFD